MIAFALCLCGADKNLKGLSKVTRENVMVFGTFKTIYLVLSSAQRLPFHSQSSPAISQYTANKIKLLLLSQSQPGSSAADKDWRCFLTCSLSFGDKVRSFSTTFQTGGNIFLSHFFANFGGYFPSFGAKHFEGHFVCETQLWKIFSLLRAAMDPVHYSYFNTHLPNSQFPRDCFLSLLLY